MHTVLSLHMLLHYAFLCRVSSELWRKKVDSIVIMWVSRYLYVSTCPISLPLQSITAQSISLEIQPSHGVEFQTSKLQQLLTESVIRRLAEGKHAISARRHWLLTSSQLFETVVNGIEGHY
jgi:hypothetical protein